MSLEFLTVFHIFDLSFQVARTLQNLDLKLQGYLLFFCFVFFEVWELQFTIHYEESETVIHRCCKNSC